jgi:hypothetical protein
MTTITTILEIWGMLNVTACGYFALRFMVNGRL